MQVIDKGHLTDNELVGRFFENDEKAFNEIYNRYWKRLYLFALGKLAEQDNAEEVVQNVFIDLWQKRQNCQIESLSAYLYRAVKNKCIDQIRQRLVRNRYEEITLTSNKDEDLCTEELLAFQELKSVIEAGMAELPEKTREIFRLNRMECLSIKEVSISLSIPERTVEHHIAQALKLMRVYLRDFIVLLTMFQSSLYF